MPATIRMMVAVEGRFLAVLLVSVMRWIVPAKKRTSSLACVTQHDTVWAAVHVPGWFASFGSGRILPM
jgi:hypothetical protein